jgi:hypothetical protein
MSIYDKPVRELMREFAITYLQRSMLFAKKDVLAWFQEKYPRIKSSTVGAHVEAMSVNAVSWRINDPALKPGKGWDLFFKVDRGVYRLWAPEADPPPVYYDTLPKNGLSRSRQGENTNVSMIEAKKAQVRIGKSRVDDSEVLQIGEGGEAVYAYGYKVAPGYIKVGRCNGDVQKRIIDQIYTGSPGIPILYLVIHTKDSRSLEKALHGALEVSSRKLGGGGEEWFQTTREELVQIYEFYASLALSTATNNDNGRQ